ncbi:MAG TPA: thrombospondin type 3 repeat-containing protein [Kiritimatiellia bacterium]|nr:thrombospondin type 3 repeat-containing protein [Kiritimatiellia bacterium]
MKTNSTNKFLATIVLFAAVMTIPARANFVDIPLHFGMTSALVDEFGRLLPGTAYEPGALIQILMAPQGIFPPDKQGRPHPLNPVVAQYRIGQGTDPALGAIGRAAGSVSINRYEQHALFARIFNRSSPEDSSFYVDSRIFVNSVNTYGMFMIDVTQTSEPIDPDDDDGDGLSNSWERSLGTDPYNTDSDGDGVSDFEEFIAGTNPLDPVSHLAVLNIHPYPEGHIEVIWASVENRAYRLQATTNSLADPEVIFMDFGSSVTATVSETSILVTNALNMGLKHFRVTLVE